MRQKLSAICSIVLFLFISVVNAQIPANGLIAYYPFNGNANDGSGNGNDGTVNGATLTTDRFGNSNKAYSFNGSNNNISVPSLNNYSYTPITYSVWAYMNSYNVVDWGSSFIFNGIIGRDAFGNATEGIIAFLNQYDASNVHKIMYYTGANSVNSTYTPPLNTWFHIVYTSDGSNSKFYINAVSVNEVTFSATQNANLGFTIGSAGSRGFWDGKIDDIRIYNRALSQSEITQLYNEPNGLIAYYPFNGNANDESGNGNNGTVNGATLTTDRFGNANHAYSFNGISDNILINNNFFDNGANSFSISGWYYLNVLANPNNGNSSHPLFNTSPHNGLTVGMNWGSSDKYSLWVGEGTPSISWNVFNNSSSNQNVVVGSWKYFTLIKSGTDYNLYIDGTLDKTFSTATTVSSYLYKLYLGSCDPLNSNEVLNGKLDDIRIYNRALSQSEITSLYGESNPLPVELTSFIFTISGHKILFNWTTATETNNYGFDIERMITVNWQKIGFVEGHGTSNALHSYSFTDTNIDNKATYRLKQIDRDGKYEYSKAIEVAASAPKAFGLQQNHPNPFNPSTTISFSLPTKLFVSLKIFDALGKEVYDFISEELPTGNYSRQWNASNMPSGIYFYRLQAGTYSETKKLLLLK